jgi:hypothetical protein
MFAVNGIAHWLFYQLRVGGLQLSWNPGLPMNSSEITMQTRPTVFEFGLFAWVHDAPQRNYPDIRMLELLPGI